jgi:UDP-GlcNAc3NAcA epimerase
LKVLTVVGNRPQFVKAAAVSRHLRQIASEVLVNSGQHYDRGLSDVFFEEMEIPAPDHELSVGSGSHALQTARVMERLEPILLEEAPDAVLVYGDTNTTLGATLVAAKLGIPVAHIEAGMRSFDRSMPEEVNRVAVDRLAKLLLCSTGTAMENLEREGLAGRARLVGDVMADVALELGPIADARSQALDRYRLEPGGYVLVTLHRAGNVDDPRHLRAALDLLEVVARRDGPLAWPLHPRTESRLAAAGLLEPLRREPGFQLLEPLGYLDFTRLLRAARCVLTDSGGVQKEAYLAGTPCVTLREETEWVETVDAGRNVLTGLDAGAALRAVEEFGHSDLGPPDTSIYGGGQAGQRCARELVAWGDARAGS